VQLQPCAIGFLSGLRERKASEYRSGTTDRVST
jgi:hypothetical protein